MTPEALLSLLREHWDEVSAALGEQGRALLLTRLRSLAEARGDERATKRALHGVKLALFPLPLEHPVRLALDGTRLVAADSHPAPQAARELLDWLATSIDLAPQPTSVSDDPSAVIIADAQRRLLAAPALGTTEVESLQISGNGLIRLLDAAGEPRFPAFQFATDGSPLPVVTRINGLLLAERDPWGAADWWLAGNSWLGGTPAQLLGLVSDELLTAAALALTEGD
ncbi:hypothetical protein [Kitasatospora kifunensis]|uniref:Uncharacterized protein n=1 Tax=Kitasatospora kifunensis TaxID=58351 RepID=A0A7W7R8U4_KITKI|nr:hypothetical protein [Kitasatospora kifunensis]MBB4927565.1 hypothetical protein [Kitasatospora kifunensis]